MLWEVGKCWDMTNKWGLTSTSWAPPARSKKEWHNRQRAGDPSQWTMTMMKMRRWYGAEGPGLPSF